MSIEQKNGFFIVLEGCEGSGKSSQAKLLASNLTAAGYNVVLTREPGGTASAEAVRELLVTGATDRWDKISELLLFSAARRNHVETLIKPSLAAGKVVICDRFTGSTYAYQGYGHGLDIDVIREVTQLAIGKSFEPDLTIYLTIDLEEGLRRADARKGKEHRFEDMDIEFHKRVAIGFEQLIEAAESDWQDGFQDYHYIEINTDQLKTETVQDSINRIQHQILDKVVSVLHNGGNYYYLVNQPILSI